MWNPKKKKKEKEKRKQETNEQTKQNKNRLRNRDQKDVCQRGGGGRMGEKVKGNIVNTIVISLHINR